MNNETIEPKQIAPENTVDVSDEEEEQNPNTPEDPTDRIGDGKSPKLITMKDIAERAHTSVNTVSKAMRNHPQISARKREEIIRLAREMGYIPNSAARTLRQHKSRLIGIVIGDNTNPYFATLIKSVQQKLKERNYQLITFNNYENIDDELRFIREMCGLHVAGVLLSPAMGNGTSAELLKRYDIPFVYMNRMPEDTDDSFVVANDEMAGYLATRYLIANKKGNILFVNFMEGMITSQRRFAGYAQALREFGIPLEPRWVISNCTDKNDGYETMRSFLKTQKPPFSVFCYSDFIALGALTAIWESGYRTPEDIAVIGIDDSDELLNNAYGLSSVKIPVREIAESAVNILLNMIRANEGAKRKEAFADSRRQLILEPHLKIRRSTDAAGDSMAWGI